MNCPSTPSRGRPLASACRVLLSVAAALLALTAAAADSGAVKLYNIPAGNAVATLKQFSSQAGLPVIFPESALAGETTRAVSGRLTAIDAITRMLAGTRLTFVRDQQSGSFAVNRQPANDPNAGRATPTADDVASAASAKNQSTNPSALAAARQDEAIELSPFVVKGETGWVATETLSGTRLRTDLRDIANEVEVFTRDFMDDLGVNNVKDALIYSVNAENGDEYMASDAATAAFYTNGGRPGARHRRGDEEHQHVSDADPLRQLQPRQHVAGQRPQRHAVWPRQPLRHL